MAWPATLPDDFLTANFSESPPDLLVRTKMGHGPDKIRRWGTGNIRPIQGVVNMTTAQVAILDAYYVTDLSDGSTRFSWTHPRTGATVEFRFVDRPGYTPHGGDRWQVSLNLEVMP